MYSLDDLFSLIDMSGQVWNMTGGYHVSIRADLRDANPTRPHGLDYGLTLMSPSHQRILGFDNSHAFDGAPLGAAYDHEHRMDVPGATFEYGFRSAAVLMSDFFGRVDEFIARHRERTGVHLQFGEG